MKALCISADSHYMVLKKYDQKNQNIEYLIIATPFYQEQMKYFKEEGYEKHQTLLGKYLMTLQCMGLSIIPEI